MTGLRFSLVKTSMTVMELLEHQSRRAVIAAAMCCLATSATAQPIRMDNASTPISMVAYRDTWPHAHERWWDIGSYQQRGLHGYNQFNQWLHKGLPNGKFDYASRAANVKLTYDRAPKFPYFTGHISARNLKPNFAYQLKLVGKPIGGSRGTGRTGSFVAVSSKRRRGVAVAQTVTGSNGQALAINGDDWTNQQLGFVGRWWNDSHASSNTNEVSDSDYIANTRDTIYGYQFVGIFVTDKWGNADWNIVGNRSYHAVWQEWQSSAKDVFAGAFNVFGVPDASNSVHFYGYGAAPPGSGDAQRAQNGRSRVQLFYELERKRPKFIALPRGTYHCRLLITEETFHNDLSAPNGILGGRWKTVLATEDFNNGAPDTNPANDIVFTIR